MLRFVSQFSIFGLEPQVWSVSDLTRYVRQVLDSDYRLQDIWVTGEVFNVSRPSSGHLYFTLKDSEASLRCVMWRSEVARQKVLPRDGEAIEVHGNISVYEVGGQYQLYAGAIRPAGEGELFQEFLRLRARLEAEGLFDPERKRPLPIWPNRIGVVTSPTGAALRDVLNVLRRRFPLVEVILAPTPVQGDQAPAGIVSALEALNTYSQPDLILLVRGGGSIEDLWAFNDEDVARAIAVSQAPVVVGVGHETDVIIADFVADVRAPTPSAAAEVATPDRENLADELAKVRNTLERKYRDYLRELRREYKDQQAALRIASPRAQVANARQRVDEALYRATAVVRHSLALRRAAVVGLVQTLRAVGPSAVLARGYAVVTRVDDGVVVRSISQVEPGDGLNVRVSDGTFGAEARPPFDSLTSDPML
ncbi:MAG: exodeoxyribonuclease VII large subunit [Anaerolineales bacterium]|nr:MAG: exodeoxyribonuclease VII large subunit [Anaerolineales bacterium]